MRNSFLTEHLLKFRHSLTHHNEKQDFIMLIFVCMMLAFYSHFKLCGSGGGKLFLILTQGETLDYESFFSLIYSSLFPPEISKFLPKPIFTVSLYGFLKSPMFPLTKFYAGFDKQKQIFKPPPPPSPDLSWLFHQGWAFPVSWAALPQCPSFPLLVWGAHFKRAQVSSYIWILFSVLSFLFFQFIFIKQISWMRVKRTY